MSLHGLRVVIVGPLPPPAGGMANQTRQLGELLGREGSIVTIVQSNRPTAPAWMDRLRIVRAPIRLVQLAGRLWRELPHADVVHVMANSGWSWHLVAAPAVWLATLRRVPVVVNYRGGSAGDFLARSAALVKPTLARVGALVVPSGFLEGVFAAHGLPARIVANVVDVERFRRAASGAVARSRNVLVARNLEPIYDVATALRAFARVRDALPDATMTVAGTGPEHQALVALRDALGLQAAVRFSGRLDRDQMADAYRSARLSLNPSRVDNMPNSVLEAMASGTPVVSTNVGGVPFVVVDGVTGLLVAPGDADAMANAVLRVLREDALAQRLADAAHAYVQQYAWSRVRDRWDDAYSAARRVRQADAWAA